MSVNKNSKWIIKLNSRIQCIHLALNIFFPLFFFLHVCCAICDYNFIIFLTVCMHFIAMLSMFVGVVNFFSSNKPISWSNSTKWWIWGFFFTSLKYYHIIYSIHDRFTGFSFIIVQSFPHRMILVSRIIYSIFNVIQETGLIVISIYLKIRNYKMD